jgi:hypothetical protein
MSVNEKKLKMKSGDQILRQIPSLEEVISEPILTKDLKRHIIHYRFYGVVEFMAFDIEEATQKINELNKTSNALLANLNKDEIDIVDIEVMDSSRLIIISLIDRLISTIKNSNAPLTYSVIISEAKNIENQLTQTGIQSILHDMVTKWERDEMSLSFIIRDLRYIRKLYS